MGLFSTIAGFIGGNKQAKASKKAAKLQYDAAIKGVEETARQFDLTREDFQPYQEAGVSALDKLTALLGLGGADEQQTEIDALKETPLYKSLYRSGEDAILANASATGGLRGGNINEGLADFGEDTLSQVIAQQLAGYGGLVGVGTGAAGAVGNFGANAVAQQAALRNQGADAKAQSALIRGGIAARNWQNAGSTIDDILASVLGGGGGGGGGFNWSKVF